MLKVTGKCCTVKWIVYFLSVECGKLPVFKDGNFLSIGDG
jgi:hypothetical protein